MKLRMFFLLIPFSVGSLAALQPDEMTATIKIDVDRTIGEIDKKIYGNFAEHLGRCIYGGIYDEKSNLIDSHGFRRDVLDAARGLNVTILRLRWCRAVCKRVLIVATGTPKNWLISFCEYWLI